MTSPGRRCARSAGRRRNGRRLPGPWRSGSRRWSPTPGGCGSRWRGGRWRSWCRPRSGRSAPVDRSGTTYVPHCARKRNKSACGAPARNGGDKPPADAADVPRLARVWTLREPVMVVMGIGLPSTRSSYGDVKDSLTLSPSSALSPQSTGTGDRWSGRCTSPGEHSPDDPRPSLSTVSLTPASPSKFQD